MVQQNLTGFVLAGGKSTRMGRDKAALALNGRTLLEHALDVLRKVAGEVCILGPKQLYANHGAPVIEDIYPGCGPLGGIHAALSQTRTDFNLIIAIDTPFLAPEFLSFVAERAIKARAVVTTPEIAGYRQPLCSVYSREFLTTAEAALIAPQKESPPRRGEVEKSRDYKIVPLFPEPGTLVLNQEEMAKFAFTADMFENLNTPEDLERAQQRTSARVPRTQKRDH
jgi:molybdenum cofactor guanylyltransferase